jgi:NAD(P)H-dependent flavin oxidoreductase YrpB (nitropropane dioxygenase family)
MASSPLSHLPLARPLLVAPMAGGPSTVEFVVAAARAGSLGFLAGGYKTTQLLDEQIAAVRSATDTFGVNLFVPNPLPVDQAEFRRYAEAIQVEADEYGLDLRAAEPVEDDDAWADKVALLLAEPVPVVSFTFAIPDRATIDALRRAGTITVQTVTSVDEAIQADVAGVDLLAVQSSEAGGHYGTFTPTRPPAPVPLLELIAAVTAATRLPVIAAGGLSTAAGIAAVLDRGAVAAMVGTVLLRADESGASTVHRGALADPGRGPTVVTRAFTGRPARALPNRFSDRYSALAPFGYPALHHLTSGLRRASAAGGNPELVNLWAGTGYRAATAEPLAAIVARLTP